VYDVDSVAAALIVRFASCCQSDRPLTVVDLGCGNGRLTRGLAVEFEARVFGVERCQLMLDGARRQLILDEATRKAGHDAVTYLEGSAECIPLEADTCDVVLMCLVLDKVAGQHQPQVAAEIARVLRPGGRLVVHNIFSDQILDPVGADEYPGVDHVVALFASAGLTQLTLDIPQPWRPSEDLAGRTLPPNYGYTDAHKQRALDNLDETVAHERTLVFELADPTTEDGHP
jgi:SAM-dependent methyltransferase